MSPKLTDPFHVVFSPHFESTQAHLCPTKCKELFTAQRSPAQQTSVSAQENPAVSNDPGHGSTGALLHDHPQACTIWGLPRAGVTPPALSD